MAEIQKFKLDKSSKYLIRWIFVCLSGIVFSVVISNYIQTENWILISGGLGIGILIQVALHKLMRKIKKQYV